MLFRSAKWHSPWRSVLVMKLFRLPFSGPSYFSGKASSADQDVSVLLLFRIEVCSDSRGAYVSESLGVRSDSTSSAIPQLPSSWDHNWDSVLARITGLRNKAQLYLS